MCSTSEHPTTTTTNNPFELKVFGNVFYIPPGASISAIYFLCSGELFEAVMADKMYVSVGAGREAETTRRLSHWGKHTGFPAAQGAFEEKVRVTDRVDQQEIRDWSKSF